MKKRRRWSLVWIPMLVVVIGLAGCAGGAGAGGAKGKITLYSPETPDMSKEIGQALRKGEPRLQGGCSIRWNQRDCEPTHRGKGSPHGRPMVRRGGSPSL